MTEAPASRIIYEIKDAFDAIMLPAIVGDRVGSLADKATAEIAAGRRVDVRLPRMLAHSGKGGPGHEEWRNVSLFDHSTSVAMVAASLAAVDLLAFGEATGDARRCAAVAFAVGMLHDVDKLAGVAWRATNVALVETIFERYRVPAFLHRFGVQLTPGQFAALIAAAENRTSHSVTGHRELHGLTQAVRRYVKLADRLDGVWLRGRPTDTVHAVVKVWNATVRERIVFVSDAFRTMRALVVFEPHHPMLLDAFGARIGAEAETRAGQAPLYHAICDDVLLSVLPDQDYDAIVDAAARSVADDLPFDFEIMVSPAGLPKPVGSKPNWDQVQAAVRVHLPTLTDLRRLLSVKVASLATVRPVLVELAAAAGIPVATPSKKATGKTASFIAVPDADAPEYGSVVDAALVSFAIGAEEASRDKAFRRLAREAVLIALLGDTLPDGVPSWSDGLARRTALALATVARFRAEPGFRDALMGPDGVFAVWFAPSAMFADMADKASPVREAVYERLRTLCLGQTVTPEDAPYACFITGEPTNAAPIAKDDKLFGIKTSAFSNRPGTPESKFSEDAATRLSPASYAEFKLRGSVKARAGLAADELPVRVCSPSAGGLSSVAFSNLANVEFSIAELLKQSTEQPHYSGLESFTRGCHFGRYESLPNRFADQSSGGKVVWGRVTFFKAAIAAAHRYGRAVHIFSGLPVARPEYFYSDCLDPELRLLLGGDGFRLEELPAAIELLGLVGSIGAPVKGGGLNMMVTAKAFCVPATRLGAGCLAWAAATATEDGKPVQPVLASRLDDFIQQEIQRMDTQGKVNPAVKLGRLAAPIQQGPRYDDGANTEAFLFRTAFDAADLSTTRGYTDRDSLVADVHGRIVVEGGRRTEGSKGFFAGSEHRAGQPLDKAIQAFAVCFIDDYWLGACRGHRPAASLVSADIATYRYVFTHTKRSKAKSALVPAGAGRGNDSTAERDQEPDPNADLILA